MIGWASARPPPPQISFLFPTPEKSHKNVKKNSEEDGTSESCLFIKPLMVRNKMRVALYAFMATAAAALALVFVAVSKNAKMTTLAQTTERYYYLPSSAFEGNKKLLKVNRDHIKLCTTTMQPPLAVKPQLTGRGKV
jgi:hypothetical protein